jgi:hypothetical protein
VKSLGTAETSCPPQIFYQPLPNHIGSTYDWVWSLTGHDLFESLPKLSGPFFNPQMSLQGLKSNNVNASYNTCPCSHPMMVHPPNVSAPQLFHMIHPSPLILLVRTGKHNHYVLCKIFGPGYRCCYELWKM